MRTTLLVGALTCAFSTAFAAELPVFELQGTVTTPRRFDATTATLPASVSVITRDTIAHSTAQGLPDLLAREAGVHVRDSSGNPDKQIDLRGFGVTGDRNTLILLDGQRLSEIELVTPQLSTIPLDAIERIEIVRGSGAVLYGGGATGGVINIITRAPKPGQHEGYAALSYGSYNTTNIRVGGIYGGDNFAIGLHGNRLDSDNYRRNNEVRQENLEGDVRFSTGDVKWKLKFGSDDQDLRLPGSRTEAQLNTDRRGTSTPNDFSTRTGKHVGLGVTGRAGNAELTADIAYRERNATAFFAPSFRTSTKVDVFSASPRANIKHQLFGLANSTIVGLDWDDWNYENVNTFGGQLAAQHNAAIFLQNQTQLGAATHLSLGLRRQRAHAEQGTLSQNRTPSAYEIGLRHAFPSGFSTYAKYGYSFRVATVDENNFQVKLLEPQTSHDAEIGAEYLTRDFKISAALFQSRLNNEIYFQRLSGFFGANINLPPSERRGLELQTRWQATPTLGLNANFSYTEAKFREGVFSGINVAGNNIPLVPRHIANLGLDWRVASATRVTADAQYTGSQYYDNDQANNFGRKIPGYTLVNLGVFHDWQHWRFTAGVRNLFNEKYYSYGIRSLTTPTFNAYPAPERTFFTSLEYRFK